MATSEKMSLSAGRQAVGTRPDEVKGFRQEREQKRKMSGGMQKA